MPELRTLPEALADAARGGGGYVFVDRGVEKRKSYAELRTRALSIARSLRELGLRPNDLVALVIGDAEQFLTALFGASLAGVVPASLYPPMTTSDWPRYLNATAGLLRSAGARAVVTTGALEAGFEDMRRQCPDLAIVTSCEKLNAAPCEPDHVAALDDIAFVQYTSGSTSVPKGVVITHRNLSANIAGIIGPRGLSPAPSDIAVSWLPLYHDMGLVGMTLGALWVGQSTVLMTPHDFVKRPVEWLRTISRYRASVSFAPNFAYDLCVRRVKDRELEGLDLSCWAIAGCGAEPIHAPTLDAFAEKFAPVGFRATSFLPSYGLAEHVLAVTFAPRKRLPLVERLATEDLAERRMARLADASDEDYLGVVSCGLPLPGHDLRIVDEDGQRLPDRQVGEITLCGPSVMLGYYKQDAMTARTIRDGWLHTGDLGYLSNGELFVCGRVKDLIIVNGRKYHPQDLEWSVDSLPGVRRGRVVAFGSAQQGGPDRVVIVAEPSGTVPGAELSDAIRRSIADQCGLGVDEVVLVPSGTVARTTSGKVQRAATKARYEDGALAGVSAGQRGLHA